jgi:hypothetical protein
MTREVHDTMMDLIRAGIEVGVLSEMNIFSDNKFLYSSARERWLAGVCPCCGFEIAPSRHPKEGHEIFYPKAIAEGVVFCGDCIEYGHAEIPGFAEAVLQSIIEGK